MKILFILHYPPPIHGSAMIGGFIKESKLINASFKCRYINLGLSTSVEEIGEGWFKKISKYFSIIREVKKQLYKFNPDLCYLTPSTKGLGFYKDAVIVVLVKISGKKIVYHFHNQGVRLRENKLFDNFLYKFIFKNADLILLSKNLYHDIQKYISKERVHCCPNGIPDLENKRIIKSNKTTIEILFLSHLFVSKGIYILLDACKVLHNKGIDFHCTITGGEGDVTLEAFEGVIYRTEMQAYVTLTGKLIGQEKQHLFE